MNSPSNEVLRATADGVCTITLNRPEAMNAITTSLAAALGEALSEGAANADVIVIEGAGANFCAGGDFNHLQSVRSDPAALRALFETFSTTCATIAELEVPVIASVRGVAMAGGFELMQACDICLVDEDAQIADNHSNFAMVPGGGGTQRLTQLVGRQRALGLILTGSRIGGRAAVEWGLAYSAHPPNQLAAATAGLARALANKDRATLAKTKRLIRGGLEHRLATGLEAEIEVVLEHLGSARAAAGIGAFIGGKREKETG